MDVKTIVAMDWQLQQWVNDGLGIVLIVILIASIVSVLALFIWACRGIKGWLQRRKWMKSSLR